MRDSGGANTLPVTLQGHQAGVTSVAFSPDGERLVTSSLDQTVKVWNSATGKEILTVEGNVQRCEQCGLQSGRKTADIGK